MGEELVRPGRREAGWEGRTCLGISIRWTVCGITVYVREFVFGI